MFESFLYATNLLISTLAAPRAQREYKGKNDGFVFVFDGFSQFFKCCARVPSLACTVEFYVL
jgi:hypothetical protein